MRVFSTLLVAIAAVWAAPASAAVLPCGDELEFPEGGAPLHFALGDPNIVGDGWLIDGREEDHLWIDQRGYVTFRRPLEFDPAQHPRALSRVNRDVLMITPFWLPAAPCDASDPMLPGTDPRLEDDAQCRPANEQGRVEKTIDADGLHITWFGLVPACEPGAPRASFSLSMTRPDAEGRMTMTFRYSALDWASLDEERVTHAGVKLGGAGSEYELFVDPARVDGEGDWGGAGKYPQRLLEGADPDEPGVWVIEVGPDGRVVGDGDGDGIRGGAEAGDGPDNCPLIFNPLQADLDGDEEGDACDDDDDNDTARDNLDNCPLAWNREQEDTDSDGLGDACDHDLDDDGVLNLMDNCTWKWNAAQLDLDRDGIGDSCDWDADGDGQFIVGAGVLGSPNDRCPGVADPLSKDGDGDGIGDACDMNPDVHCREDCESEFDYDGDRVPDADDICPTVPNPDQQDWDRDGVPDACDPDADDDGILDIVERLCPDGVCSDPRPPALGGLILPFEE